MTAAFATFRFCQELGVWYQCLRITHVAATDRSRTREELNVPDDASHTLTWMKRPLAR